MAGGAPLKALARTDARDWLVEADEPIVGLQMRNGGEMPGAIVTPALLELVRKARAYRFKVARAIEARDEGDRVTAWVEVVPDEDGEGCRVAMSDWLVETAGDPGPQAERDRQVAMARQLAELTARLGPKQELLSADSDCPELQGVVATMRAGVGKPWIDFVTLDGTQHHQPVHWRLLDGARLKLAGSSRTWRAALVPQGREPVGNSGFELLLCAEQPMPDSDERVIPEAHPPRQRGPGIGLEIAPVLRQPVSRIIANAETIRTQMAGPLADEYATYAADIASAGEHLLALIDDLTTLEMVEDEEFSPAPDKIDLADLARRAAGILGVRARERGIVVDAPKDGESAPAIGEFRRVLQVLLNLLGNAIRYSPEGSSVWLRVEHDGARARVIVADQGEGLDQAQQERVFGKFERLGRSGDGGSGLGLYISRRLAEAMQGSLTVESARGHGARFILELPADSGANE
ncbi:HAMP domain-containing histidine kinase [Altererythrobacter sp. KTW20L]|uniref:sensor histidine kinase n=1 Tax=Altererythrobacter sp. KTW20L TaxID=2942210 RepID=UPI0020BF4EFD|nr:HAMP domain-containing sensor histidine kinase [Altererythrobacter sp. KTW20L]MCL6251930.1 HAMP domain-containing histidine kinase [Altererythrobacter sp. KTW20L]